MDPTLSPAYQQYRRAQQQSYEQQRAAAAERAAATGDLESGGFDRTVQQLGEARGQNVAGYGANPMRDELQARRQQLTQALTIGGGLISDEERLALQKQLGELDAEIRKLGIQTQGTLGQSDISLRDKLGTGGLGLGLLDPLLGDRYRNTSLGYNIGATQSGLNADTIRQLFGI